MEGYGRVEGVFENDKSVVVMKVLIVTHTSNDIFNYNFIRWLKLTEPEWEIDVFEFYSNTKQPFSCGEYANITTIPHSTNKIFRFQLPHFFSPLYIRYHLKKFLKGKRYNVIQCHWITSPMVVSSFMKDHCDKLFITFWGGEISNSNSDFCRIFHSKKLYLFFLTKLLKKSDGIIVGRSDWKTYLDYFPFMEGKLYAATLGSTPLEELYRLMELESKTESKIKLGIDDTKLTIIIGYSGKQLHQHIPVVRELSKSDRLKNIIHIIAPMTRDANIQYIENVRSELEKSGYSYTLLSGVFLSDLEIARLRNATDITLQLSEFDGYSRSIIECLCAMSLVIYGRWLDNYKEKLDGDGFYALPVSSIKEAVSILDSVVNDFESIRVNLRDNYNNGKGKYLWSVCIKDWVAIYTK